MYLYFAGIEPKPRYVTAIQNCVPGEEIGSQDLVLFSGWTDLNAQSKRSCVNFATCKAAWRYNDTEVFDTNLRLLKLETNSKNHKSKGVCSCHVGLILLACWEHRSELLTLVR